MFEKRDLDVKNYISRKVSSSDQIKLFDLIFLIFLSY
ncbi:hypothetical protein QE382_002471 [Sphingobacterium zeae]|uniref:Uncharacterized protein n=1 Tax=Sphingobacterium zeae TaxID=1776859 RepID=A0ABU0U6A0_9SPHI|nr:hypothetical protein [Sphingobacterium zeae]